MTFAAAARQRDDVRATSAFDYVIKHDGTAGHGRIKVESVFLGDRSVYVLFRGYVRAAGFSRSFRRAASRRVRSYFASKSSRLFVRRNKRVISLGNSQRRRFHLVIRKLFAVPYEKGYRRRGTVEQQLQRRGPLARNNFHFVRLFANCSRYAATARAR